MERHYEMHNDNQVYYQYDYPLDFFERFLNSISPNDFATSAQVAIVYYCLKLQTQASWEDWYDLYHYLQSNKQNISEPTYLFRANQALTNFITHQKRLLPQLPDEVNQIEFDLYYECIELRLQNGQGMTGSLFENIVATGYRQKGAAWARAYIADNNALLPDNLREGLTAYCLARLHFQTADYPETIAILHSIAPYYHHYYFPAKLLLLQAYYEQDNYDAFMTTIDSFRHTLTNHPELPEKHQNMYKNAIGMMLKLYRLRLKYDPKTAANLRQLLNDLQLSVPSKIWAIAKLNGFEKAVAINK